MPQDNDKPESRGNLPAVPPKSVPIGPSASLDLSWLPEEERRQLLQEHTKGMLKVGLRAQEIHADVGALDSDLHTMTETTRRASLDDNAVTITHSQTTSIGRTEVIMGNTDRARSGKLSKSQTGEKDWTPLYIIVGLIAIVLIISALAG